MLYFIGAGSGDPELLTVKGKRIIDSSDVIIYTGSLVNKELFTDIKEGAKLINSAPLNLDEVLEIIFDSNSKGLNIARVHTGDPSMYGAVREQMAALDKAGIEYEVIPGVSSVFAGAAAIKREFTLPGVTQTLILTRMAGRTPVPESEDIENLAKIQASMAIFLSIANIDKLVKKLMTSYPKETPAAVVYKASWPEQKIIISTLENIADKVKEANINKTAIIYVGRFLADEFELSKLYDKCFGHEFREAKDAWR